MFGAKIDPMYVEQDSRDGKYKQLYEYRVIATIGALEFNRHLNEAAGRGWELVNATMMANTHVGYLKRSMNP